MDNPSKQTRQKTAAHSPGLDAAERRTALRYPFSAAAEVIELPAGPRLSARTNDLGLEGCYIDTIHPFPVGSRVRVRIHKGKQVFDAQGKVKYCQPGLGMGIGFGELRPDQSSVLVEWLAEDGVQLEPERHLAANAADREHSIAARLVHLLVAKGIVTEKEAAALLGDLGL